jgi:CheY-like chemotaxis protein
MTKPDLRDLRVSSTSTILVVERAEEVRYSVQQLIEAMGFDTVSARDEDEAVELAKQTSPELIIVNQHEPVSVVVGQKNPSLADRIRVRAGVGSNVKLLTHSDASITISGGSRPEATHSGADQLILILPQAGDPSAVKECFTYSGNRGNLATLLRHFLPVRFRLGDTVRIKSGPLASFTGKIEGINQAKSLLKVAVKLFGQVTPVKLHFRDVEKLLAA